MVARSPHQIVGASQARLCRSMMIHGVSVNRRSSLDRERMLKDQLSVSVLVRACGLVQYAFHNGYLATLVFEICLLLLVRLDKNKCSN